ncbi:MAG: VCBS domain-containing protein, partial [Alphaproteobacteria bacterium]
MLKNLQESNVVEYSLENGDVLNFAELISGRALRLRLDGNDLIIYEDNSEVHIKNIIATVQDGNDGITIFDTDNQPIDSLDKLQEVLNNQASIEFDFADPNAEVVVDIFNSANGLGLSYSRGSIGSDLNYHNLLNYTDFSDPNIPSLSFSSRGSGAEGTPEVNLTLSTPGSSVEEAGLTARASSLLLNTTGVMKVTADNLDGGINLTIGGVTVIQNGVLLTAIIDGQYGTLTITNYNAATGEVSWSYTMDRTNGNGVNHSNGDVSDDFQVTVSDSSGKVSQSGTLGIDIIDDTPLARNDGREVGIPASGFAVTGNVFEENGNENTKDVADEKGADKDGAHLTYVETSDGQRYNFPDGFDANNPSSITIETENGTLVINQLGDYTYTVKGDHPDKEELFNYGIVDGDGDTSDASLSMDLVTIISNSKNTLTVDEQFVPDADTVLSDQGSTPDAGRAEVTGDIRELTGYDYTSGSWNNDGDVVFSFAYTNPQTGETHTGIYNSTDIQNFTFSIAGARTEVVNGVTWYIVERDVVDGNGQFGQDGQIDYTFRLSENGEYSYKIHTFIDHSSNNIKGNGDDGEAQGGKIDDLIIDNIDITFTDSVGTSGNMNLELNVHDDVPVVVVDTTWANTLISGWNTDDISDSVAIQGSLTKPVQESYDDAGTNAGLDGSYRYHYEISDSSGKLQAIEAGQEIRVEGTYGYIVIKASGEYVYSAYTLDELQAKGVDTSELAAGNTVTDVFTYRLVDADGDWVNADLSINIVSPSPEGSSELTASEKGLNTPEGTESTTTSEITQGNLLENGSFPVYFDHDIGGKTTTFQEVGAKLYFTTDADGITVPHETWMDSWAAASAADIPSGWTNNGAVYSYGDPATQGFTLLMDTKGNYYFELTDNFDHPNAGQSGADDILTIIKDLTFGVISEKGNIGTGDIDLKAEDDAPVLSTATVTGAVDEDALTNANDDSANGNQKDTIEGSLSSLVHAGADGVEFGLNTDTSKLPSLTSNGKAISYTVDATNGTITAKDSDGAEVFV